MDAISRRFLAVVAAAKKAGELNGRKKVDPIHRRLDAALLKGVAPLKRELATIPKSRRKRDLNELLWIAADRGKVRVVEFLLEEGAKIGYKGKGFLADPRDALLTAIRRKHLDVVALLAPCCDTLSTGVYLRAAVEEELPIQTVRLLIRLGANVNYQDPTWGAPLHYACRAANKSACVALLDAGARVNVSSQWGTPLDTLITCRGIKKKREREIVNLLLDHGAYGPNMLNVDAATSEAFAEIEALRLEARTAKVEEKALPDGPCKRCGRPAHRGFCRL